MKVVVGGRSPQDGAPLPVLIQMPIESGHCLTKCKLPKVQPFAGRAAGSVTTAQMPMGEP